MKVACPSCNATLNIDDAKIPAGGARIKCPTCQTVFPVKPGAAATPGARPSVPLPGASRPPASRPAAVPLPGITAAAPQATSWEDEKTRAGAPDEIQGALTKMAPPSNLPPVAAGRKPAVPLPGITAAKAQTTVHEDEKTRVGGEQDAPRPALPGVDFDISEPLHTAQMPVPLPGNYEATRIGELPGPLGDEIEFADEADIGMTTEAVQVPAPSRSHAGAVPLPGHSPPPRSVAPAARAQPAGAVPLPGQSAPRGPGAVPLPGHSAPRGAGAVPLPGQSAPRAAPSGAVPLPGQSAPRAAQRSGAVPLPGNYQPTAMHPRASLTDEEPSAPPEPLEYDDAPPATTVPSFDLQDLPSPKGAAPRAGAVPLPGPRLSAAPSIPLAPPAPPAPRVIAPAAPAFDNLPSPAFGSDLPTPAYSGNLPSPRAPHAGAGGYTQADPAFAPDDGPYNDLPMPASDNLPMPSAGDLPSPSGFSMDTEAPPPVSRAPAPPPGPPPSFGEVEFGGGGESLEFDPSNAPRASSGDDDLEADLSAPVQAPVPQGSSDGLEMLSFIDQTAKDAGAKEGQARTRRFHIRRRSGKVFGPFEDAVIIKMLEDGQLLGNEEISLDGDAWAPIGGEATFQAAITRLMESPTAGAASPSGASVERQQRQDASMDRLKNLYEGRMAAVAVVESKEPMPFRKKVPFIVGGVLVLAIGAVGAYSSTTPYGVFWLKKLFPAHVSSGSREFAELQTARKGLLSDTFKGYQQARDVSLATLRVKEFPEARAIWCQSIFYLQRKYGVATPAEIAEAAEGLQKIELLGAKNAEVVKARAGNELAHRSADAALALLGDALARSENADDLELSFLRAEALGLKNQSKQARSELEGIVKKMPTSARALHALGNWDQSQKEDEAAVTHYEAALKADPEHVSSAIELAAIELLIHQDLVKGGAALELALDPKRRDLLGPTELGKALALKAETLAIQHKLDEAIPLFQEALKADPNNGFTKVRLASAWVEKHDLEKALPLFKEASEASPETLEYVEGYLTTLIGLGMMDDANKAIEASTRRFPGNARLAYLTARVDDALDRTKQAEAAYLRAVSADPKMVDANLYLARLYLRFRRVNDARPQLEEALKKAPKNADVRVVLGELALSENDTERAESELKRALELNPNLAEAWVALSRLELTRARADLALEDVEKALALNPHVFGGRVQHGTALWKLGRLEESAKELAAARTDEPRNNSIVVTLGAVQLEKKDLAGATGTLMAALTNEPSNPEANFFLAKVMNLKAEHTGAIEHMRKALDLAPKRPEFHFWMGRIYLDAKKGPEAIDEWKATLELDSKFTDALEALGHVYLERNDVKKAVQYFQRALDTDPSRTAVQAAIGDAYFQSEEWDHAIQTYERAVKADPDLRQVYFKLGQAYMERKKYDLAITNYKKASTVETDNALVWQQLGYAYKEKKQKREAAEAFEKYLQKKPDAENKKEIEDEIDYLKTGR